MKQPPDPLDRPIAFHRCFVDLTGSIPAAVMLSQAYYWQKRCEHPDGFWWKTYEEWQEETGLSRDQIASAKQACGELLEVRRRGVPCKNWYRVNTTLLQSRLRISRDLDSGKPVNWMPENPRSTVQQTTSETSSENIRHSDCAKALVKAYRARFSHYRPKSDPKTTKKELAAAEALLECASATEILELATSALADRFAGNRRAASTLQQLAAHWEELRAQFPAAKPKPPRRQFGGEKTPQEVIADWEEYLARCRAEGLTPMMELKPDGV